MKVYPVFGLFLVKSIGFRRRIRKKEVERISSQEYMWYSTLGFRRRIRKKEVESSGLLTFFPYFPSSFRRRIRKKEVERKDLKKSLILVMS